MKDREAEEKMIREMWFPKHLAYFRDEGTMKVLTFKQPESSNYWCRFIIDGRVLIVYGDIGDAIYMWGRNLTWEWLAGLDRDYFAGKCMASENGRGYKVWNPRMAKAKFEVQDFEHHTLRKFNQENGEDFMSNREEWCMWLAQNGQRIFGDGYEDLFDIGMTISNRCHAHLLAIQMAVKDEWRKAGNPQQSVSPIA